MVLTDLQCVLASKNLGSLSDDELYVLFSSHQDGCSWRPFWLPAVDDVLEQGVRDRLFKVWFDWYAGLDVFDSSLQCLAYFERAVNFWCDVFQGDFGVLCRLGDVARGNVVSRVVQEEGLGVWPGFGFPLYGRVNVRVVLVLAKEKSVDDALRAYFSASSGGVSDAVGLIRLMNVLLLALDGLPGWGVSVACRVLDAVRDLLLEFDVWDDYLDSRNLILHEDCLRIWVEGSDDADACVWVFLSLLSKVSGVQDSLELPLLEGDSFVLQSAVLAAYLRAAGGDPGEERFRLYDGRLWLRNHDSFVVNSRLMVEAALDAGVPVSVLRKILGPCGFGAREIKEAWLYLLGRAQDGGVRSFAEIKMFGDLFPVWEGSWEDLLKTIKVSLG